MNPAATLKPEYGNWVSTRLLYLFGALTLVPLALAFIHPALGMVAAPFFLCFAYFAYARYLLSPQGGNLQPRIQEMLLDHLDWDGIGAGIDIGCGSAALTVAVAKKYPRARVIGVDNWGAAWEYSKGVCERNAEIERVSERTIFQRASAAALPFEDSTFEAAFSNLVFHEVHQVQDKKALIQEALRVVKKGGSFAFQDLFLWKSVYGDPEDLLATVRGWDVEEVRLVPTCNLKFIPKVLKLPFMLGTIGILAGKK